MRLRATSPEGHPNILWPISHDNCWFYHMQISRILINFWVGLRVAVTSRFPQCSVYFRKLPSADGTNDLKVMNSRKQPVSSQGQVTPGHVKSG